MQINKHMVKKLANQPINYSEGDSFNPLFIYLKNKIKTINIRIYNDIYFILIYWNFKKITTKLDRTN